MYEQYTHYVPGDSPAMQRFAIRLATEFANLCDHAIAPSESIANVLRKRGVTTDITAIPTGIDTERFSRGDGSVARRKYDVPEDAFVVGHVGRLAPEKNLLFLSRAVRQFLRANQKSRFLLVGDGPSLDDIGRVFSGKDTDGRLCHTNGVLDGQDLVDAYHAMDAFAFASHSETQGMVLAEAMAAGVPVVGVDAPGTREVVRDSINGRLLPDDDEDAFADALLWHAELTDDRRQQLQKAARDAADAFTSSKCAARLAGVYKKVVNAATDRVPRNDSDWAAALRLLGEEWKMITGVASAVGNALFGSKVRRLPNIAK